MQIEGFILQINRLFDNYDQAISEKKKEDKIQFLRKELERYSNYQFETAVNRILKDENIRRFPTLAQIKANMPIVETKETELKDCDRCRDGLIPVWIPKQITKNEISYYQYSFACPFCEAGKTMQGRFPILPTEYQSIPYEILRNKPKTMESNGR